MLLNHFSEGGKGAYKRFLQHNEIRNISYLGDKSSPRKSLTLNLGHAEDKIFY